jgi:hypothetical protein
MRAQAHGIQVKAREIAFIPRQKAAHSREIQGDRRQIHGERR